MSERVLVAGGPDLPRMPAMTVKHSG